MLDAVARLSVGCDSDARSARHVSIGGKTATLYRLITAVKSDILTLHPCKIVVRLKRLKALGYRLAPGCNWDIIPVIFDHKTCNVLSVPLLVGLVGCAPSIIPPRLVDRDRVGRCAVGARHQYRADWMLIFRKFVYFRYIDATTIHRLRS